RRVPARHRRRRQPGAPAVPASGGRRGGVAGLPAGGPRPLLRLLPRQLPDTGAGRHPAAVRPAQRPGLGVISPLSRRGEGRKKGSLMTAKKLDVVLINPSSRTQVYQSLGTRLAAVENPVWAGLLASFCRNHGLSVEVIDAEAEQLVAAEVAEQIDDLDPVLTAVVAYGHQ